jgi:hypothetical protein
LWSAWITQWQAQVNATRISDEAVMLKSNSLGSGVTFLGLNQAFYERKGAFSDEAVRSMGG